MFRGGIINKVKKFFTSDVGIVVFLFFLAAAIRAIPEFKAGIWPIGYDTFNTYVAQLATYHGSPLNWIKTANLLYFIFLPFKLAGLSPDLIVKIFGPFLYGALSAIFYYFTRQFFKFSPLKSFLASLFILLQLASLRLSWDLYRNELGLIFLFCTLVQLPRIKTKKNFIYFLLFSVLVVLSHQLITVILEIILLVDLIYLLVIKKYQLFWKVFLVFFAISGLFYMIITSSEQSLYDSRIIFISSQHQFWYYFYNYNEIMSYQYLKWIIWYLFYLFYGFLLPLTLVGFWRLRKNIIWTTLTVWLLFGTFSALIFFGKGLMVWERWMFMLVFPLSIYSVEGIYTIGAYLSRILKKTKITKPLAAIFWLGLFSFFVWQVYPFLTSSYSDAKPPLANDELNSYFPRTMIHNAIGLWDIPSTVKIIDWLNTEAPTGSVVIVDNRYRGLMMVRFDLDRRYIITNDWSDTLKESTFDVARNTGHTPVYLIWNTTKSIKGFDRIYNSGNKGVYKALPKFYTE